MALDKLQQQLTITPEKDVKEQFQNIANELFNHFSIVKEGNGDTKKITYRFMELEFYYCSPEHCDVITYPRKANAGDWFFHPSGVDICFASNIELNDETGKVACKQESYAFGGILIRALSKHVGENTTYITGPLNCCYELFDKFTALHIPSNFPVLVEDNHSEEKSFPSCGRYFKFSATLGDKLKNINHDYWDGFMPEVEENKFEEYLKREYCFFDAEAFEQYLVWKKETSNAKNYAAVPSGSTKRSTFE